MKRLLLLAVLIVAALPSASAWADSTFNPTVGADGGGATCLGGCSIGSGGGGGPIVWFDLGNVNQDSLNIASKISAATGSTASQIRTDILDRKTTAQRVSDSLSPSSVWNSVIWYDSCYDDSASGVSQYKYKPTGYPAVVGCTYAGFNPTTFPFWSEIHGVTADNTSQTIGLIVGWNVQIWREGDNQPIFQRRVGLGSSTDSSDPVSWKGDTLKSTNKMWWYGGLTQSDDTSCPVPGTYDATGGGRFSGCQRSMGMLGALESIHNDISNCIRNWSPSNTDSHFTGIQGVSPYQVPGLAFRPHDGDASGYQYDNGARPTGKLKQGSPTGDNCYWNIGDTKDSGEAFWMRWSVGKNATFSYKLQGRPGFFYAIHIVALDAREQIVPPHVSNQNYLHDYPIVQSASGTTVNNNGRNDNYFRVWMANGSVRISNPPKCTRIIVPPADCPPQPILCQNPDGSTTDTGAVGPTASGCGTGDGTPTGINEPVPNVTLNADNPVPTRTQTQDEVAVTAPDSLNDQQAIFPMFTRMLHFSPQMRYDGSVKSSSAYSNDYVQYDSPDKLLPAKWATPGAPQMMQLSQPAQLSKKSDPSVLSVNDFGISWLRPTLQNPCNADQQLQKNGTAAQVGTWPTVSSSCDSANRNAWDDYLEATSVYETQWVSSNPQSYAGPIGWIGGALDSQGNTGQWLRCNDTLDGQAARVNDAPNGASTCDSLNHFDAFHGTALDADGNPLATSQKVQGFVRVVPTADQITANRGGALGVKLTTNDSSKLGGGYPILDDNGNALTSNSIFHIWDRATGSEMNGTHPYVERPSAIKIASPEQAWFCTNGVPAGANIDYTSSSPSANRTAIADDQTAKQLDSMDGKAWSQSVVNDSHESASGGNTACGGYTTAWAWSPNWSTDWTQPWGDCGYNTLPPTNSDYINNPNQYTFNGIGYPNDNSFAGQADAWGRYSSLSTWSNQSSQDVRGALVGSDGQGGLLNGTVPYDGLRPGRQSVDGSVQQQGCHKTYHGHYKLGDWNIHTTPTQVTTTVPDYTTYPIYQWGWIHTAASCRIPRASITQSSTNYNPNPPSSPSKVVGNPFSAASWNCVKKGANGRWTQGSWIKVGSYQVQTGSHDVTSTVNVNYYRFDWRASAANSVGGSNCFPSTQTVANTTGPNRPVVATQSDTNYSAKPAGPPADPAYDPFAEQNWGCDSSNVTGANGAAVQKGQWGLGRGPGAGWGLNQAGSNLPDNSAGYVAEWSFTGLDPATANNTTWSLSASYDGNTRAYWLSRKRSSVITDQPAAAATVAAYGTRPTR